MYNYYTMYSIFYLSTIQCILLYIVLSIIRCITERTIFWIYINLTLFTIIPYTLSNPCNKLFLLKSCKDSIESPVFDIKTLAYMFTGGVTVPCLIRQ